MSKKMATKKNVRAEKAGSVLLGGCIDVNGENKTNVLHRETQIKHLNMNSK